MSPSGEPAMALLTYHGGPSRETGDEVPSKGLTTNAKLGLTVTTGPGSGTETYWKGRFDARTLWLLEEGMTIPVLVDPQGTAVGLDEDGLASVLDEGKETVDAADKKQSSSTTPRICRRRRSSAMSRTR